MKDDKTRVIKKGNKRSENARGAQSGDDGQSQRAEAHNNAEGASVQSPEPSQSEQHDEAASKSGGGNKTKEPTRVTRPGRRQESSQGGNEAKESRSENESLPDDPVVGWLVVVGGPGQGRALALGYGMNGISRSADARVPLDFGDDEISRNRHAMVAYDPKSRRFFVHHGDATNLTYLESEPVLQPTELSAGATIAIGRTELRFVPLCGPDFDWQDM